MKRARLTISILGAMCILLTASLGTAFAQGISGTDNAGQQQYGPEKKDTDVLGEIGEVEESQQPAATTEAAPAAAQPAAAVQPVQQESGQLPFTGFATFAVVLLGLALLGGGMVLRRSTREGSSRS